LLGWAVRTDDLDGVAARIGSTIAAGSRRASDGAVLRWRSAGIERATAEPCCPFFIEWSHDTRVPRRGAPVWTAIGGLRRTGDAVRLASWLGANDLPINVSHGPPAVQAVVLDGGVVLDA